MLRRFVLLSVVALTACASGTRVTDFNDRSLGYGWLDIKEVDANRLNSVSIYQFRPQTTEPYYSTSRTPASITWARTNSRR